MELENIILSEISQDQKAKTQMVSLIWVLYTQNKCSNNTGHGSHTKWRTCMGEIGKGNLKLECGWCASWWEYSNLKLTEATMGRVQEVVKTSGRDKPMWIAIHRYMEATLGVYLCRYLYPKLAKMLCLSYYLLFFSST
jgi:hypothetical protein